MLHRPQYPIPIFCAAIAALALLLFAPTLPAQQQSPSSSTSAATTNLGTLIVSPQKAPDQATASRVNLRIQRQALNFNAGSSEPSPSAAPAKQAITAEPKQQPAHIIERSPPRPLHVFAPQYPPKALAKRTQGSVTVAFTIQPDGTTTDIHIVDSTPPGLFDDVARAAVSQWLFHPATADGVAVARRVSQTLLFRPPAKPLPTAQSKPQPRPEPKPHTPANSIPGNIHPTHLVAPRYPPNAYRSRQGGSVTVSFTVRRSGRTGHIRVLMSKPHHVFDRATVEAVRQWRFQPVKTPTQVVQTINFTPPD